MLVLDFDGVVADALLECAAVTWYAARLDRGANAPRLPDAANEIPSDFIDIFRQVRAYSRTLDDFMVANALDDQATIVDRATFQTVREAMPATQRADQAAIAEEVRGTWRDTQYDLWIGLHRVHAEVARLILNTEHEIAILSAKDEASIRAILRHHGLERRVSRYVGSCHDKFAVLGQWLEMDPVARRENLIFVDDSIENVADAARLPLEIVWAGWGYHGVEDRHFAQDHGIPMRSLTDIDGARFRYPQLKTCV
ncbi:MAG: hypothetical protein ACK5NN_03935 [Sphingomonadaceae bacterium]